MAYSAKYDQMKMNKKYCQIINLKYNFSDYHNKLLINDNMKINKICKRFLRTMSLTFNGKHFEIFALDTVF